MKELMSIFSLSVLMFSVSFSKCGSLTMARQKPFSPSKISLAAVKPFCDRLKDKAFAPLSAVLIENDHPDAIVTHGLPDEAFLRGAGEGGVVPMTKSEVRAVALSKLRLTERAVCYDIGAGTGSVAIEMALQAKHGHVYAVERRDDAVELLKKNQAAFHVENLTVISGTDRKSVV